MPDGTPHVTPVWVDHDDREYVLVNTARGRRKEAISGRTRRSGERGSMLDPTDPYRYVSVRGEATLTETGVRDHIDELAKRDVGGDECPHHGEESGPRVVVKISTDSVSTSG